MRQKLYNIAAGVRAGLLVGVAILSLGVITTRFVRAGDSPKVIPVALSISDTPLPRDTHAVMSFAPIVKKVAPSVIKINVVTKSKTMTGSMNPFGDDDFFRRFFGDQNGGGGNRMFKTPPQHGLGSGVIVSDDGYILTNNHVVEDADTIKVVLNDGRELPATVVGRDPKTDIAVVKIDAKNLPFVTIADSDQVEIGDVCLAIGNPFGIGQTVTMGIVSAKGRGGLGTGTDYEDFIQTDAAINPGNSGGALVDAEGRLIGINAAILSRTGGNQGIGFAVPANLARNVMESLIKTGKVVRGYLGVSIQDVTPELAKQFQIPEDQGSLVGDVVPKGPAEKAGFKSGDVILEFNHKPVTDSRHLKLQVAETLPGSRVPVKILRDGKDMNLDVTVKELPGSEETAKLDNGGDNSSDTLNGVTVSDLDAAARTKFEIPDNVKGALIANVEQDSASYDAGLRPGDVIEEINHKPVEGAEDAVKLTEHAKEKSVLVKLWGHGASHFVVVDESSKS